MVWDKNGLRLYSLSFTQKILSLYVCYEQLVRGERVKFKSLLEWLQWIKCQHTQPIDLSLERVGEMASRLDVLMPQCPVITVAGTNGKGSCVAGLEAIYRAGGYRVGAFTSPYLFNFNEQIRIQGFSVEDEVICYAFERIIMLCGEIRLTQFELGTLAALLIFRDAKLDVWLLEVGLGGRYDAVNALDADMALISSIGIDHVEWLGETRELIAREKAGIMRPNRPAICGDFDPPQSLIDYAYEIKAPLFCQNKQFGFTKHIEHWEWWSEHHHLKNLPMPSLALQNMATVLMAVHLLQNKLPISSEVINTALSAVTLPGRIQVIPGDVTHIFDVSHNPAAAEWLANYLQNNVILGNTHAVFSMLSDKDILATIQVIKEKINYWHCAPLAIDRGASLEKLDLAFLEADVHNVSQYSSIATALKVARTEAKRGDRIVIFGSFHTVSQAGIPVIDAIPLKKRE
jgi:dihydrofolate synthase / folylpolyglutamate synthase